MPRPPRLLPLLDGIALLNPIRIEIVRQYQYAQIRKTHIAHRHKRRPQIRAMRHRTASAIQHYVRRLRNLLRPALQFGQSRVSGSSSVKHSVRNVRALIQRTKTHAHDGRFVRMSRRGNFLHQVLWLHRLRAGPGIVAIVRVRQRRNARSARIRHRERHAQNTKHYRRDAAIYFCLQDPLRLLPRASAATILKRTPKKRKAGGQKTRRLEMLQP